MHRYREFGLVSDADETLRRAVRDGFKRAGLSHPQFLDALAWYRDHVRPGTDEAALMDAFSEFAAEQHWPPQFVESAVAVYQGIRDGGAAVDLPSLDDDRATVARGDEALRRDPARYWRDAELQDAVFEARERLEAVAGTGAPSSADAASPANARVREIEAMLHDKSGAGQRHYWSDAALREDYARALASVHGDGGAPGASGADAIGAGAGAPAGTGGDGRPGSASQPG